MIDDPMRFELVDASKNRAGLALLTNTDATLAALDRRDAIDQLWDDRLDPKTKHRLVRSEEIVRLGPLKFKSVT